VRVCVRAHVCVRACVCAHVCVRVCACVDLELEGKVGQIPSFPVPPLFKLLLSLVVFFETGSHSVAQSSLKIAIFLSAGITGVCHHSKHLRMSFFQNNSLPILLLCPQKHTKYSVFFRHFPDCWRSKIWNTIISPSFSTLRNLILRQVS
jgi:hypothetical protein